MTPHPSRRISRQKRVKSVKEVCVSAAWLMFKLSTDGRQEAGMSDEFFRKTFGDSESVHLGSGWVSGVSAVFLGLLGLGAVLCLRFPALLTLPEARAHYPMGVIRPLIQGMIFAAFVLAAVSAVLRQRKVLALTGARSGRCRDSPGRRRRPSAAGSRHQNRHRFGLVRTGPVCDDHRLRAARANLAAAPQIREHSAPNGPRMRSISSPRICHRN